MRKSGYGISEHYVLLLLVVFLPSSITAGTCRHKVPDSFTQVQVG